MSCCIKATCLWQRSPAGLPVVTGFSKDRFGEWAHNDINEGGFCFRYRLLQLTICQSLWGRRHDDFLGKHVLTKQKFSVAGSYIFQTLESATPDREVTNHQSTNQRKKKEFRVYVCIAFDYCS